MKNLLDEIVWCVECLCHHLHGHHKPKHHHRYSVHIRRLHTMNSGIALGGQGTLAAQLLDNGQPIAIPSGSSWAWQATDPSATIAPGTTDPTGGTVVITVPAGDTNQSVTISASTTDPSGAMQVGTLVVPYLPVAQKFTISVTQIA